MLAPGEACFGETPKPTRETRALPRTYLPMPTITVRNRQRAATVRSDALQIFAEGALSECLKLRTRKQSGLAQLDEVSVALVSDRRIADLHRRFLNERGPTDVITFQHGEIVISAETARRQARAFGTSLEHELHLYIVHGLLHLHGYDDKTPAGAAEMKRLQESVVKKVNRATERAIHR
jgi:probable rRNA maturation factor